MSTQTVKKSYRFTKFASVAKVKALSWHHFYYPGVESRFSQGCSLGFQQCYVLHQQTHYIPQDDCHLTQWSYYRTPVSSKAVTCFLLSWAEDLETKRLTWYYSIKKVARVWISSPHSKSIYFGIDSLTIC